MKKIYSPSMSQQLVELTRNFMALVEDFYNLVVIEAQIAKRSLKIIFWLSVARAVFVLSTWICFLGAVFSWLSVKGLSASLSFCLLSLLNLLFITITYYLLKIYRNNLKFNKTRKYLFSTKGTLHASPQKKAPSL